MKNFRTFISKHDAGVFTACCVLVIATIVGSIYGFVRYKETKAKNQAVARAIGMKVKARFRETPWTDEQPSIRKLHRLFRQIRRSSMNTRYTTF
jgi:hypothetical protein